MKIIFVVVTIISLIAVVVVSILNSTALFEPGLKQTPTHTPITTPTPTPTPTLTPTNTPTVTDYISLIDNLREAGEPEMDGFIC